MFALPVLVTGSGARPEARKAWSLLCAPQSSGNWSGQPHTSGRWPLAGGTAQFAKWQSGRLVGVIRAACDRALNGIDLRVIRT